jgi:hypothetical protein
LESGNHHRWWNGAVQHKTDGDNDASPNILEYPTEDDHPSRAGNQKATAEFMPLLNNAYSSFPAIPEFYEPTVLPILITLTLAVAFLSRNKKKSFPNIKINNEVACFTHSLDPFHKSRLKIKNQGDGGEGGGRRVLRRFINRTTLTTTPIIIAATSRTTYSSGKDRFSCISAVDVGDGIGVD